MIRFTGAPDDWKHDTINFYTGLSFVGAEFYTYGDRAWLGGRAQSVVGQISKYLHQSHYIYISTPVTQYLRIPSDGLWWLDYLLPGELPRGGAVSAAQRPGALPPGLLRVYTQLRGAARWADIAWIVDSR